MSREGKDGEREEETIEHKISAGTRVYVRKGTGFVRVELGNFGGFAELPGFPKPEINDEGPPLLIFLHYHHDLIPLSFHLSLSPHLNVSLPSLSLVALRRKNDQRLLPSRAETLQLLCYLYPHLLVTPARIR